MINAYLKGDFKFILNYVYIKPISFIIKYKGGTIIVNKNWKKIVVYVMLFGMLASTILTAFASFM